MYKDIIYINIIIILSILLLISLYLIYRYHSKLTIAMGLVKPLDPPNSYKVDMEFLNELMLFKVTQARLYYFEPLSKMKDIPNINDREVADKVASIIKDVYDSLSPAYKRSLAKYYTDNAILVHISEVVNGMVLDSVVDINTNTYKNRQRPTTVELNFTKSVDIEDNDILKKLRERG